MGRDLQAKRLLIVKSSTELGDAGPPRWQTVAFCEELTEILYAYFSHGGSAETRPNDQDSPQVSLDGAVGAVTSTPSRGQRRALAARAAQAHAPLCPGGGTFDGFPPAHVEEATLQLWAWLSTRFIQ